MDLPSDVLIDIKHLEGQVIIRLNRQHRFYKEAWQPLQYLATAKPGTISDDETVKIAKRSIEALTILMIAYGKAESMNENPEKFKQLQSDWGEFTNFFMAKIKDVI